MTSKHSFFFCRCLASALKVHYQSSHNLASTTWKFPYKGSNYSRHGNFPNNKLRSQSSRSKDCQTTRVLVNNFNPALMCQGTSFLGLCHLILFTTFIFAFKCLMLIIPRFQVPYINYSIQFTELCIQNCGMLVMKIVPFPHFLRQQNSLAFIWLRGNHSRNTQEKCLQTDPVLESELICSSSCLKKRVYQSHNEDLVETPTYYCRIEWAYTIG